MAIFKCKMCGGNLEITGENETIGTCEYCGTRQTIPKLNSEERINLYDRANHFRRNNEYDKAANIYEQILAEDSADAEAYWELVLCRYGIEYVEDPTTHKRIPTINRAQFTAIYDDDNYKLALQYADPGQRLIFEEEAKVINEIQKEILAISSKEEPFDVFICYKETDESGRRTHDSVMATDLYHQLTQEGFKVFFSRITLEDKLGTAYEPYIFAALNSAKVMVVLGTKPEFFRAVWVKNEWSRFLSLVKASNGKKILIPAYKDMDPYDLPEEFSHLQAQDMSKLGFMQDLTRGIRKILGADLPRDTGTDSKESQRMEDTVSTESLYKRVQIFLEEGDFVSADMYCEKMLDINPENADAYLGKLLASLGLHSMDELANYLERFDDNINYKKAIKYGDDKLKAFLTQVNEGVESRKKAIHDEEIYNEAIQKMNGSLRIEGLRRLAKTFRTIEDYKDSSELAEQCERKADDLLKELKYKDALHALEYNNYKAAIDLLEYIPEYKDSAELIANCKEKLQDAKYDEEQRQFEAQKIKAEEDEKQKKIEHIEKVSGLQFLLKYPGYAIMVILFVLIGILLIVGAIASGCGA